MSYFRSVLVGSGIVLGWLSISITSAAAISLGNTVNLTPSQFDINSSSPDTNFNLTFNITNTRSVPVLTTFRTFQLFEDDVLNPNDLLASESSAEGPLIGRVIQAMSNREISEGVTVPAATIRDAADLFGSEDFFVTNNNIDAEPATSVISSFSASSPLNGQSFSLGGESSIDIAVGAMANLASTLEFGSSNVAVIDSVTGVTASQRIDYSFSGGTFNNPSNPSSGLQPTDLGGDASISHMVSQIFSLGLGQYTITASPTVTINNSSLAFQPPAPESFTFEVVPEPFTMLGSAVVLAIGAVLKKRQSAV